MNLGIKTQCESCGAVVLGITDSLQKIDGRYLCSPCAIKLKKPNMTLCQDCGQVISVRAAACPKCGAPQSHATAA
jgi:predicted amidophosphoribosyltransferase